MMKNLRSRFMVCMMVACIIFAISTASATTQFVFNGFITQTTSYPEIVQYYGEPDEIIGASVYYREQNICGISSTLTFRFDKKNGHIMEIEIESRESNASKTYLGALRSLYGYETSSSSIQQKNVFESGYYTLYHYMWHNDPYSYTQKDRFTGIKGIQLSCYSNRGAGHISYTFDYEKFNSTPYRNGPNAGRPQPTSSPTPTPIPTNGL